MKKIMNDNLGSCLDVLEIFSFSAPVFCYSFDASMCSRSINDIHNMEEMTVWVAILSSTVGYILHSSKL